MFVVIAQVKGGKMQMTNEQRSYLDQCVKSLEGKTARITITRDVRSRTNKQNKYYWGVIVDRISNETDHTDEEVHEFLKTKFLGRRFIEIAGEEVEITKSTKKIDTIEMTRYIEQIRAWAAQFLGMTIPSPQQVGMMSVDPVTGEVL